MPLTNGIRYLSSTDRDWNLVPQSNYSESSAWPNEESKTVLDSLIHGAKFSILESGLLSFGIQTPALGIRNVTSIKKKQVCNPESKFHSWITHGLNCNVCKERSYKDSMNTSITFSLADEHHRGSWNTCECHETKNQFLQCFCK